MLSILRCRRFAASAFLVCALAKAFGSLALAADKGPSGKATSQSLSEELPRVPPVDAAKTLATFRLEHGFRLELVAAEPSVVDPVDACFDENGRMYVAEMRDYPFSWEPTKLNPRGGGKKDAGTIRLLEDTDGDGKIDRSIVFADKLNWPTSVCCYRGGVFVLAPPHLHYFKDTNGDGVADVRQIIFTGFDRNNVQAIANNMKWSPENRIVFAAGRNGGNLVHDGKSIFTIRGSDLSFDPATLELSPVTGGDQFGLSYDDWGNRFVCNNSNHIEQVVFEDRYVRRNPYYAVSGSIRAIAKEGAAAPVFRRSQPEPWRVVRTRRRVSDPATLRSLSHTEQFAVGYFTSAAGITVYRGDAYPPPFCGNVFIGDVGGNLVHRKILKRDGAIISAERADADTEFVTSIDNWFRPVNFVNAPDGTLYILDMYRETIEHPFSIPDDIKLYLDLQSGDDRGRVYRLVPAHSARKNPVRLGNSSSDDLVRQLESPNAWNRETSQRLLWERQDKAVVPALGQLARRSAVPLGRWHALNTLDGLDSLSDDVLSAALIDSEPRIRARAILLCEPRLRHSAALLNAVKRMTADRDGLVRFQLALSLGEADPSQTVEPLARLAKEAGSDELLRSAIMTSVANNAAEVALRLLSDSTSSGQAVSDVLLADLAAIAGAQPDPARANVLLKGVFAARSRPGLQLSLLRALGQGLGRRGSSISALLTQKGSDERLRVSAAALFKTAAETASNASRSEVKRAAAIGLLGFAPYESASPVLIERLTPQTSPALQSAAAGALAALSHRDVGKQLLAGWKGFGPKVRRDVIDGLVRDPSRLGDLFDAIESRRVARGEIERDVKQILMNHPNTAIRRRARKVFEADLPGDRAKVVGSYRPALERSGNSSRGRAIYEQRCAVCHRVDNLGHAVGPDLASTQNKSPADLLIAILDPNREAQPNFVAYTLVTNQGTVHNGIIVAESAASVTLRRSEGKEDQILRSQIDELISSGKSLMPEGLEKDIPIDQMADLIAFIKTVRPTAPR